MIRISCFTLIAFAVPTCLHGASGGGSGSSQSTIASDQLFAWGVNVGWLNARPDAAYGAPDGQQSNNF